VEASRLINDRSCVSPELYFCMLFTSVRIADRFEFKTVVIFSFAKISAPEMSSPPRFDSKCFLTKISSCPVGSHTTGQEGANRSEKRASQSSPSERTAG